MVLKECQQVMVHLSHTEVLVLQVREKMLERFVYLPLIGVFKLSCSVFFFLLFPFFGCVHVLGVIKNTTDEDTSPQNPPKKVLLGNLYAKPFCF